MEEVKLLLLGILIFLLLEVEKTLELAYQKDKALNSQLLRKENRELREKKLNWMNKMMKMMMINDCKFKSFID